HGGGAMRDFVGLGTPDHLDKGVFEDAEQFVGHFRLAPHEGLESLDPFEVGNDHAAGVAENIGNYEKLVPALVENQIGLGGSRTVRAFGENAALQLRGVAGVNDTIDG